MENQLSFFTDSPSSARTTKNPVLTSSGQPHLVIHIDGAARGNPGPAGAGIYVTYQNTPILKKGIYLGQKTNNQAEYLALVLAILFVETWCEKEGIKNPFLAFFSDSELLVRQMSGIYKIKNPALVELKKFIDVSLQTYSHKFTHVLREKNKDADKLANLGIDKKTKPPTVFSKILSDYGLSI
jgi:ribonuclease HI